MSARLTLRELERCPFCGGALRPRYLAIADRLATTGERFAVDECAGCGAGMLNPAPIGDVSAFYPQGYLSGEGEGEGEADDGAAGAAPATGFDAERWYRYDQYAFDFRLLERATGTSIGETASYVDLGCGSGERVSYAFERGCRRAVGVDKFDFAKSRARAEVSLINAEIVEFVPDERFTTVSLFHVLEHLEDPRPVLAHIARRILAPGGSLIIQVPNYGAVERRVFGRRWFCLDAPRHYWHFNDGALTRLLEACGYRVQAPIQRNAPLHPVSIASSLHRELDVQRIWVRGAGRPGYTRLMTLAWAAATLATAPLSMLASRLETGSMLTVVATAAG